MAQDEPTPEVLHGTAVALGDQAVLLRGTSGAGKSDLALRVLMTPPGTLGKGPISLISDDYVNIHRQDTALVATAPDAIKGLLEIRGLGIRQISPIRSCAQLTLIADLVAPEKIERLPQTQPVEEILGIKIPTIKIAPFEASAPAKLIVALSSTSVPPVIATK